MNNKQPTQAALFKTFLKEFTLAQLCEYCLLTYETHSYLIKFPGEEFFRYAQICDKFIIDPKLEVK